MIGTDPNLDLPSLSDTMAVSVGKIITALSDLADSIADKATPAAIDINAALDFGGNSAINVGALRLGTYDASYLTAGAIYYNDGEFYAIDATGVIQLTSLGAINAAGIGGIGGDYGGINPAAVTYDDPSGEYRFTEEPGVYADVVADDVVLYNDAGTFAARISADAATVADYTITLPAAPPISTAVMQLAASGEISASNTVPELHAPDFHYTSEQALLLPASAWIDRAGTHTKSTGGLSGAMNRYLLAASVNPLVVPLPVRQFDRITSYAIYVQKNTGSTHTISARIYKTDADGTETALGSGCSSSANGPGALVLNGDSVSIDVLEDSEQYYLVFTPSGSIAPQADELLHAAIGITRP